jgi:DNA-binding transcriptional LysR family regulator
VLEGRNPPTHASELAELPWLALRTFYRNEVQLTHRPSGELARVPIRPRMSTDSLYALHSAAVMGLGACIGSAWLMNDDIAAGRLVQLVPQWHAAPLPVYLTYSPARFQPARLRRFIEMVRLAMADPTGRAWEVRASSA